MAKAVLRGGLGELRTLKHAHTSAIEANDILVVNGQVLVACNDYEADEEGAYVFRGPVEFPKEAPLVIATGDVCYYVAGNGNVNKTSTANTKVGTPRKAAASADTVVLIELGENK